MKKAPPTKYDRPTERLVPPEILPCRLEVPDKTILCLPEHELFNNTPFNIMENLKPHKKRDWMNQHAYFCLPLVMGNQHGFIVKSCYDFDLLWNGGSEPSDLKITIHGDYNPNGHQVIASHFGLGIVTIQNRFSLRTPKGVNLMVMNAPNYFIDGLQSLTAVVEADNLRRDFTYNLKCTRPNHTISIKKNQPLAAVLPYPRYFIDDYELKNAIDIIDPEIIDEERRTSNYFAIERREIDSKHSGANGFRYMDGEDVYGIKFKEHQKKLGD